MNSPYPWGALRRVDRERERLLREARRQLERSVNLGLLDGAASELLGANVHFALGTVAERHDVSGARLWFEDVTGASLFALRAAPELAQQLLARLLGRTAAVNLAQKPLEPRVAGALAAFTVELARRTCPELPLSAVQGPSEPLLEIAISATMSIDERPYPLELWVRAGAPSSRKLDRSLASVPELPVAVPLVIAQAQLTAGELAELEVGDALLPGSGLMLDGQRSGPAALAAPSAEYGTSVVLTAEGELVLRGERIALPLEGGTVMTDSEDAGDGSLRQTVLEAPIIVRVELGSVTLLAREWAELAPGDVIETGQRLAEPVTLRIAGREVARGELVNVEGQLGVRIQEFVRPGAES